MNCDAKSNLVKRRVIMLNSGFTNSFFYYYGHEHVRRTFPAIRDLARRN